MSKHYTIVESVGSHFENVHDYEGLEKHHPTQPENLRRRHYGDIDGRREEFVYSPSGERMVSKDFVLLGDGNAHVDIPSPLTGYARRSERLDRWGTVEIYDGVGESARLIGRVRHMEPILVANGEHLECGQPLGRQGNKSPPGIRIGLHTHMDINERHLSQFKSHLRDIDTGVITTDHYPGHSQNTQGPDVNTASTNHAHLGLDDPRNAANPDHALYNELKGRIPEASEPRLLQFTAACHSNKIAADNLDAIHLNRQNGLIGFVSTELMSSVVIVDVKQPSPTPAQSIQQIQHYDQHQAQLNTQIQTQITQTNCLAQHGSVMGGSGH